MIYHHFDDVLQNYHRSVNHSAIIIFVWNHNHVGIVGLEKSVLVQKEAT
jgi:hypothetical protein